MLRRSYDLLLIAHWIYFSLMYTFFSLSLSTILYHCFTKSLEAEILRDLVHYDKHTMNYST